MRQLTLKCFTLYCCIFLLSTKCVEPVFANDEIRYTNYNIHAQSKDEKNAKASYANYTRPGAGHIIISPGTKIVILDKSRKSFTFTYEDGAKTVVYEFHNSRMGMSLDEYLEKITSSTQRSLDNLTDLERHGVAEGKALVGMSREGVLTALGYPATHKTPSIKDKSWVYWKNRFSTLVVEFGSDQKVKNIRE